MNNKKKFMVIVESHNTKEEIEEAVVFLQGLGYKVKKIFGRDK